MPFRAGILYFLATAVGLATEIAQKTGTPLRNLKSSEWLSEIKSSRQIPQFAAAAIAMLALGIGLNTAMSSIVNAMPFKSDAAGWLDSVGPFGHCWPGLRGKGSGWKISCFGGTDTGATATPVGDSGSTPARATNH